MPVSKKQVKSIMGVERNDIWLRAAHALEGTRCAAMQSGIGSANPSVLQCGCQCVEPLLLGDSVRDRCVQAQGWFINKQQDRQASGFQSINLPADDLGDMECEGRKECRIGQEGPTLVEQIRRQCDRSLDLPLNGN